MPATLAKKLKSRLPLLLIIIGLFAIPGAATGASQSEAFLKKVVERLHKSKSLTAAYTVAQGAQKQSGTITVEGTKFMISTPQMKTWFDGHLQWTAVAAEREVSICEPTQAEVQQVNPFAIIDSHAMVYTSKMLKSTDPAHTVVELTARNTATSGGIRRVVITFNSSTLMPERLVVTMSERTVISIVISSIKQGEALGAAKFRPTKADLKGLETIDLR